jgi:hypothetical protein
MANTTNFGWETPDDTDLVKDGAAAMRTLGNAIDASFVDLKGGTTGQILSKNSNTDLDYTWINNDQGDITEVQAGTGISVASGTGPIPVVTNTVATAFDAKGDLIVGTGADTFAKLTVGTNGHTLVADSAETTGLKWQAPAAASFVGCSLSKSASQTLSNATSTLITWDVEAIDTDAFHSTSSNTSRITIPSGKGGKYLVIATVTWAANNTGLRSYTLDKNGTSVTQINNANPSATTQISQQDHHIIDLAVGDYIELSGYQNSGGNLDVMGNNTAPLFSKFSVQYLGA